MAKKFSGDLILLKPFGTAAAGNKPYLGPYISATSGKQLLADSLGIHITQFEHAVLFVKNSTRKAGIDGPEGEYDDMPFEAEIFHQMLQSDTFPQCFLTSQGGRPSLTITSVKVSIRQA